MLIAHYIGDHAEDDAWTRLGCQVVRAVQKGPFGRVTHTEAILHVWGAATATIGSSTLRREAATGRAGVRVKPAASLKPGNWRISDVPAFKVDRADAWFRMNDGARYDWRGAWATVMPGKGRADEWFCNEAVGAAVGLEAPDTFTPSQFAALCFSLGRDVTADFYAGRLTS